MQSDADHVRVTAQLIDARADNHLWAESYDRRVEDVFALQDEISSTIAASVAGDLTRAEGERARQQGTENLEAWSLYQLGLQHANRYTRDDSLEAGRLFERAGADEGDTVVAYCMVGWRASFTYLAARMLGYETKFYDGSWHDWGTREDLPYVTGTSPR